MLPLYEFMLHYVRRGLQNPAVKKTISRKSVLSQYYLKTRTIMKFVVRSKCAQT